MPWVVVWIFSVLLSLPLQANQTIRLTNGEWPPYLSENLSHYGYASHLVSEAFASVGVDVEYGFFPWKRSFQYAKDGASSFGEIWHGTIVWIYNDERAKNFIFSDVVMEDYQVLFSLRSNPVDWETMDDLAGKTIGGTLHTFYPVLESAQEKGVLHIDRARDYQTLFTRLLAGRIDAVPYDWHVGSYFMKNNLSADQRAQIRFSPTVIGTREFHLILTKQVPKNHEFIELFNQGLKNIKANGVYQEIQNNLKLGTYDHPKLTE
ncbi:transporter substrate-binding domain-containing protein [Vibrio hannami]|uniref:substrate-binding periplasmic protein n=1 Tax=Vibrio hannami TaxID=2717094 RepID=UPI00240EF770|nr:transporter substrate-binding domain-containing protein [Vibrio hannami]MDG3086521.1 transporter substrate-binding domain-containing protein [Vibrio hannami]